MIKELVKKDPSQDNNFYIIGWCAIAIAIVAVVLNDVFHISPSAYIPACVFHEVTGLYCLGCGGTRAVFALARGNILQSLDYHPVVLYMVVAGGWFMVSQTVQRLLAKRYPERDFAMHFRIVYLWIAVGLSVLHCIIKNVVLLSTGVAPM